MGHIQRHTHARALLASFCKDPHGVHHLFLQHELNALIIHFRKEKEWGSLLVDTHTHRPLSPLLSLSTLLQKERKKSWKTWKVTTTPTKENGREEKKGVWLTVIQRRGEKKKLIIIIISSSMIICTDNNSSAFCCFVAKKPSNSCLCSP